MTGATQDNVDIEVVWPGGDSELQAEVVDFWLGQRVLAESEAHHRANEVCCVARCQGTLVAISTARLAWIEQVRAHLYYYRCFVAPEYREQTLAARITVASRDALEQYAQERPDVGAVGVVAVIESDALRSLAAQPVWRRSRLALLGYNANGQQVRVYWFEHARLPLPDGY